MSSISAHVSPELLRLLADAAGLATARDRAAFFGALDRLLERVAPNDFVGLFVFDKAEERLRLVWARGFTEELRLQSESTAMDRHPGWVFRNQQMLYVPDVARDAQGTRSSVATRDVRSRLFFPLVRRGETVGVFGLGSLRPDDYDPDRIALFTFVSDILSVAYNNISFIEELDQQLGVIRRQHEEILALASPILDVGRGVLLTPIIGELDEARVDRLCQALLETVHRRGCRMVLLDATSMSAPRAALAALRDLAQSLRLMGVRCAVSGITAEAAAYFLTLGTDLGATEIFATVAEALDCAAQRP